MEFSVVERKDLGKIIDSIKINRIKVNRFLELTFLLCNIDYSVKVKIKYRYINGNLEFRITYAGKKFNMLNPNIDTRDYVIGGRGQTDISGCIKNGILIPIRYLYNEFSCENNLYFTFDLARVYLNDSDVTVNLPNVISEYSERTLILKSSDINFKSVDKLDNAVERMLKSVGAVGKTDDNIEFIAFGGYSTLSELLSNIIFHSMERKPLKYSLHENILSCYSNIEITSNIKNLLIRDEQLNISMKNNILEVSADE